MMTVEYLYGGREFKEKCDMRHRNQNAYIKLLCNHLFLFSTRPEVQQLFQIFMYYCLYGMKVKMGSLLTLPQEYTGNDEEKIE